MIIYYLCLFIICSFTLFNSSCTSITVNNHKQIDYNDKQDQKVKLYTSLAVTYINNGDITNAKRVINIVDNFRPKNAFVYSTKGLLLEKTNDIPEALLAHQNALKIAPNEPAILNNFASFLCRTGKFKQAEYYFLQALSNKFYENQGNIWQNRGLCFLKNQKSREALDCFKRVLLLDPYNKQAHYWINVLQV